MKHIDYPDVNGDQVLECRFQDVPERKLSCDHNADEKPLVNGLVKNAPPISIPFS